jgi:hypothetical protein
LEELRRGEREEEEGERPTSRDVTVRSVDEAEGARETQLGRGIRGVVGGEDPVHDIRLETTLDDPERVVMLVVHEENGQIRTDCETEALKAEEEASWGKHI